MKFIPTSGSVSLPVYPYPTWRERALDLVFPPTCVHCRRIGRWVCAECWRTMPWLADSRCGTCGRQWADDPCGHCRGHRPSLDGMVGATEFAGAARDAVHALKYQGRHGIAPTMSRVMSRFVTEFPIDFVAPVPLHAHRRRERGYDQADLLARGVARALDLEYESTVLKRVRRTRQQTTLGADERLRNVTGAFEPRLPMDGETVLLVDDVITTGATMGAAATALKQGGAGRVLGLSFACAVLGADAERPEDQIGLI